MFKRLFRGAGKQERMTNPDEAPDVWRGTARDQWTVPGTSFGTEGWRLETGTSAQMSWVDAFGGTMTLTRDEARVDV